MSQPQRPGSDSEAPRAELVAAAADVLRQALATMPAPHSPDGELRAALRRLTAQARQDGLRAEQLVVVLKQEWAALPAMPGLPAGGRRTDALARVVSLCIKEYYADAPAHDGGA